ncbi:hypothetical protein FPV67DRAFT_1467976 [Lyophyllum atratum]|nr:hypothetical protein FPV67DRAFT_1467976 [Lyophyllum atratum]
MTPEERGLLRELASSIFSGLAGLTAIILVYGNFILLLSVTIHSAIRRGLTTRPKQGLFVASILGFLAASVYCSLAWTYLPELIRGTLMEAKLDLVKKRSLFNGHYKLNIANSWLSALLPVFNDSFVTWRGWVLFPDRRRALIFAVILCLAAFAAELTVLVLISSNFAVYSAMIENQAGLAWYLSSVGPSLSLAANVVATYIIAHGLWRHRKFLVSHLNQRQCRQFRIQKILGLLVDSGLVYCGLQVIVLILCFVDSGDFRLHLSLDITTQAFAFFLVEVGAMYPTLVGFLVRQQGSFMETYGSEDHGAHVE